MVQQLLAFLLVLCTVSSAATSTVVDGDGLGNTIAFVAPTGQTYTLPTTTATIARTDAANTFTGVQTMTSPSFTTPTLGAATATTINGNTFTTGSGTLTLGAGKTTTFDHTSTFTTTDAQTYTFPATSATIARTDAANTFTGVQTMTSPALTTPVLGTATSGALAACTDAAALTVVPTMTGGWTEFKVSGSDVTTTGQSLIDVTGLVTGTLSTSSNYEFNATLYVTTTAVATGCSYGVHVSQAPTVIFAMFQGPTTVAANLQVGIVSGTNADNIASLAFLTTASETGCVVIHGFFTTGAGASPAFSIRHLKVTSGTSTVKIGSVMRIKKL